MPNKNLVILIGHLGGDPEVRYAASGTCVANFSLATSWGKKDSAGNWENFTDWHKVVCFGAVAEKVAEKAQKGHPVMVTGSIRYESWEKDGEKKYMTKIMGNQIDILAPGLTEKPKVEESPVDEKEKSTREAQAATEEEDDLPF
jgi:single-strand DNA-binding protein